MIDLLLFLRGGVRGRVVLRAAALVRLQLGLETQGAILVVHRRYWVVEDMWHAFRGALVFETRV